MHAGLLLLSRTATAPGLDVAGSEADADGIELSIVSGRLGGAFAQTTAASANAPDQEAGGLPSPLAQSAAPSKPSGKDGTYRTAEAEGHSIGGIGVGDTPARNAGAGGGYDPGAYVSLAPLSFTQHSEPGLWAQVRRCLKDAPRRQVTLNVVLDDTGAFVDAWKGSGELTVSLPSPDETGAVGQAVDALRGCSPFHDIKEGLARRLVLVVRAPAGKAMSPDGLGD